jgi:GT2 family glycosyltransferase
MMRRDGTSDSRGVWTPYGPPYDRETYVFGGCGGATAYRRSMLQEIGAFEERFFMYCEDVDLNWRAQLGGFCCIYVPQAVVHHHLSATGGGTLASYYVGRNTLWVIARCYPGSLLRRHWRRILRGQWAITWSAVRAWRGASARARLRGQVAGLFTWPRWLAERRAIQRRRRVSDEYVESILSD